MRYLVSGVAFLAQSLAVAADPLPVAMHWQSERGLLTVTNTSGNGVFAGSYEAFDGRCRGPFHATGRVAADRVVFSVHFDRCGFLVIWNGTMGRSRMITQWVRISRDPLTGKRQFRRGRDVLARWS